MLRSRFFAVPSQKLEQSLRRETVLAFVIFDEYTGENGFKPFQAAEIRLHRFRSQ
jgi:hypothetical protein